VGYGGELNFMRESMMNRNSNPGGGGGRGAAEWESRWLNVNSEALAIVAEERWVGESDDDFPWC